MTKNLNPSCPVLQRFFEDLKLAGLSERTPQSYCRVLRDFSETIGKRPAKATAENVREYFIHMMDERKFAASTMNVVHSSTSTAEHREDYVSV